MILAAGASNRMGRNKMLLPLDGESILRRAAGRAVSAGLDPVVVVLGHDAERARAELAGIPCRTVVNPDYARGVNVSLRAGIAALPADTRAVVVILADMPFVTASMIETLVERYRETAAPLVVSDYAGVNAPPMLYDRSLFPELGAMEGEGCGKQVVKKHRSEAAVVFWPAEALADVDVPDDYERARSSLASG
ncbi:MAG TPA: nucleotidyltransferase family protein [Thermoanaerobaculia bacterium]|nr:nucleotidyltransferase family protein [Thermoanaerobaculia bacterium]